MLKVSQKRHFCRIKENTSPKNCSSAVSFSDIYKCVFSGLDCNFLDDVINWYYKLLCKLLYKVFNFFSLVEHEILGAAKNFFITLKNKTCEGLSVFFKPFITPCPQARRNQTVDLQCKSTVWFLHAGGHDAKKG